MQNSEEEYTKTSKDNQLGPGEAQKLLITLYILKCTCQRNCNME